MKKRWKPKKDERYFCIGTNVEKAYNCCCHLCRRNLRIGNYFKTKAEAERKRKQIIKVLKEKNNVQQNAR